MFGLRTLATQPTAERCFVVDHPAGLFALGYTGADMNRLAPCSVAQRKFVLTNARKLYEAGYTRGFKLMHLAKLPGEARSFVLAHADELEHARFQALRMSQLAIRPTRPA